MSVCGGCGEPTRPEDLVTDLGATDLCPECAVDAPVPCSVCGREVPVRIYAGDGGPNPTELDDITGIEEYIAVCRECDSPEGVMR